MPANFDPVAVPYRWVEYLTFGRRLERCRNHFLPQLLDRTHALVLGDGDGRFLACLYAAHPTLQADAVDTSARMLSLLRRRCEQASSAAQQTLRTFHQNAMEHVPDRSTDLIVTHFFFDCFSQSELNALLLRLLANIDPHALWLISDFRIPNGPMRLPARVLVRSLYAAFKLLTGLGVTRLPDHRPLLYASGLVCIAQHLSLGGLLTTELWQRRSPA